MNLSVKLLGVEIATITLDIDLDTEPAVESVIETGVKKTSVWWMKRMLGL